MTSRSSPVMGALLGLSAFGLYAGYDVTIKVLGASMSPMQVLFCACGFAVPMILAHLKLTSPAESLWPVLPGWTALRIVVTLLNGTAGAYAFATLPLAQCYAVFFLMPLLIALLAVPVLGEAMDLPRGLAILGGLLGVLVALRPGQEPLQWGHLAALAGASFGAVSYIILRKTSGVERPGVVLVYPLAAMVLALGCVMPWVWVPMTARDLGLTFLMAVELYVGGLMIVAAYRHAAAIIVAPMQYSQIIWAGVFGRLLFGERLDALTLVGIAIIILCGLFILWRSGRTPAQQSPTQFDPA